MSELFSVRLGQPGTTETCVRIVERGDLLRHGYPDAVYVADTNTQPLVDVTDGDRHGAHRRVGPWVVLPSGEEQKHWQSVARIIEAGLHDGVGRDGVVIAAGGGVVCDVAAFAASVYLRGISAVLVPTTLLAMVDAAVGGKTGINFGGYKNMVGTFHAADEVRIDISLLAELPEREFKSGLAEVIKSAMLGDAELFEMLESKETEIRARSSHVLLELVRRSLAVKKAFVEADFTETGTRAFLNLGHTFGHGLESVAGLGAWSHGEAVVWGMARALEAGSALGITDSAYRKRCLAVFDRYGYRIRATAPDVSPLIDAMSKDKKKRNGEVQFILQKDLCETVTAPIEGDLLARIVAHGIGEEER